MTKEDKKLHDIELRLNIARSTYAEILTIFNQVDLKRRSLELDVRILEDAKAGLLQGQLALDPALGF